MEKFTQLTSVAIPLDMDNLDTDQLMPKQFLHGIDKSGLDKGLFYNLRFTSDGEKNPACVFNKLGFEAAQIIVAGPNFGCGSSREHAVWGLMQYGIRVVIAPGFGEIFYSNCFNNGLLAARISEADSRRLFVTVSSDTPKKLTVNLKEQTITAEDGTVVNFTVAPRHKTMLAEGLDMIDATLKDLPAIEAFRAEHEKAFPWMTGLPGQWRRNRDQTH